MVFHPFQWFVMHFFWLQLAVLRWQAQTFPVFCFRCYLFVRLKRCCGSSSTSFRWGNMTAINLCLGNGTKARYLARAQPHLLARVPEHLSRKLGDSTIFFLQTSIFFGRFLTFSKVVMQQQPVALQSEARSVDCWPEANLSDGQKNKWRSYGKDLQNMNSICVWFWLNPSFEFAVCDPPSISEV